MDEEQIARIITEVIASRAAANQQNPSSDDQQTSTGKTGKAAVLTAPKKLEIKQSATKKEA